MGKIYHGLKLFMAVVAVTVVTGTSAEAVATMWYPIQPIPQGSTLYAVDCSLYECSAVGASGASLGIRPGSKGLMAAGVPFSSATTSSAAIYANTYNQTSNNFFAFASGNYEDPYAYALQSNNGQKWTATNGKIALNNDPHMIQDVTWTGSRYVAVGQTLRYTFVFSFPLFTINISSTPIIATSADGVTWATPVASPVYTTNRGFNGVATNGTTTVVVGGATGVADIRTSVDGVTWTVRAAPATANERLLDVFYDASLGKFIAVGENGTVLISTSATGATWTDISLVNSTARLTSVTTMAGQAVVVGNGIAASRADLSAAGAWTMGLGVSEYLYAVTWTGSELLAVGNGGTVLVSYDAFLWFPWDYADSNATTFYGAASDGVNTVAVGYQGTIQKSTDDGVNWLSVGTGTESFRDVAWIPLLNKFVAVGANGVIKYSTNGSAWTNAAADAARTTYFYGVSANGVVAVAVGSRGVYISTDGINWTPSTDAYPTSTKTAVAGSPAAGIVAVGSDIVEHSADNGATWQAVTIPTAVAGYYWSDVYWSVSKSLFIAVGYASSGNVKTAGVMTSADGITWVSESITSGSALYSASDVGGVPTIVGEGGALITRRTSIRLIGKLLVTINYWASGTMPGSAHLYGITETSAGHAVAVGSGSTVLALLTDSVAPQKIVAPLDLQLTVDAAGSPVAISDPVVQGWLKEFYAIDDRDYLIFNLSNNAPASLDPKLQLVYPITFSAVDKAANTSAAVDVVGNITFTDVTAPTVTAPNAIIIPSVTGVLGSYNSDPAVQTFLTQATANDNLDGPLAVSNDVPALLPIGNTVVTFSATDAAGNTGTAQSIITVYDAEPPTINLPKPEHYIIAATGPGDVPFSDPYVQEYVSLVTAYDNWDSGQLQVFSNQPVFPVGTQVFLDFYATDKSGNIQHNPLNSASITVLDLDGPVVSKPTNISLLATSALGTEVSNPLIQAFLSAATATDNVDGPVTVFSDAPAVFPIGITRVNFIADDSSGNRSYVTAEVEVTAGTGGTKEPSSCLLGGVQKSEAIPKYAYISLLLMLMGISLAGRRYKLKTVR